MILVTVGTQLPFPRLIHAMDRLAVQFDEEIRAQIGPDDGDYPALKCTAYMGAATFTEAARAARVIVAHAGIGTILTAKALRKPLVIVPRRAALGEHRNDHQLATARHAEGLTGIHVAWEVDALADLLAQDGLTAADPATGPGHIRLIAHLRRFIHETDRSQRV